MHHNNVIECLLNQCYFSCQIKISISFSTVFRFLMSIPVQFQFSAVNQYSFRLFCCSDKNATNANKVSLEFFQHRTLRFKKRVYSAFIPVHAQNVNWVHYT